MKTVRAEELRTKVLQAICDHWHANGYGPTIAEIIAIANPTESSSVMSWRLGVLRRDGLIDFNRGVPRSARPTDAGWELAGYQAPVPARRRKETDAELRLHVN